MSMETPAKYLHLKGMPTVLPSTFFSWELNQALMAKGETELMAAGMAVAVLQANIYIDPVSLKELVNETKYDHEKEREKGKTSEQRDREMYVETVDLLIMGQLKGELELMLSERGEDDLKDEEEPCNEREAKKPRLSEDGELEGEAK